MSVKNFRPIRLHANSAGTIPQIVKELVKALNQQRTDIRSFASSQRINLSKVYNWIAGRAAPKNNSIDAIHRYFKKIKFRYTEKTEKQIRQQSSNGKRKTTAQAHQVIEMEMIFIRKVLKDHSEQLRAIGEMIRNLQETRKQKSGVRKKEM